PAGGRGVQDGQRAAVRAGGVGERGRAGLGGQHQAAVVVSGEVINLHTLVEGDGAELPAVRADGDGERVARSAEDARRPAGRGVPEMYGGGRVVGRADADRVERGAGGE